LFAIACRVGDQFTEIGSGKSKKLAKRMAAHMMAERLRNLPSESAISLSYEDDDEEICRSMKVFSLMCNGNSPEYERPFLNSNVEKLINIYRSFQKINGTQIKTLQVQSIIF